MQCPELGCHAASVVNDGRRTSTWSAAAHPLGVLEGLAQLFHPAPRRPITCRPATSWLSTAMPVVQRHPLKSASLQSVNVTAFLVGDGQHSFGEP